MTDVVESMKYSYSASTWIVFCTIPISGMPEISAVQVMELDWPRKRVILLEQSGISRPSKKAVNLTLFQFWSFPQFGLQATPPPELEMVISTGKERWSVKILIGPLFAIVRVIGLDVEETVSEGRAAPRFSIALSSSREPTLMAFTVAEL